MTREEAIKALTIQLEYWEQLKEKNVLTDHEGNNVVDVLKMAIDALQAEPVKHGEWVPCTKKGLILSELIRAEDVAKWYGYKCSECNYIHKGNALVEYNFCPNCGAKMCKGGDDE